jgi:hypothetical protein
MSRTHKASKSPGYEYWSRRPFNKCGGIVGPFGKHRTHKAERVEGKRHAQQQVDPPARD